MKIKRLRLTHKGYDEMILYACRLYAAYYLRDDCLAKYYKQCILMMLGIRYYYEAAWNTVPDPRWSYEGYKHCGKLWYINNCVENNLLWFSKSDLYYFCRKFVDWLYAECERDPSKDRDDNQKGGSK